MAMLLFHLVERTGCVTDIKLCSKIDSTPASQLRGTTFKCMAWTLAILNEVSCSFSQSHQAILKMVSQINL
jgi:hypothetical protein